MNVICLGETFNWIHSGFCSATYVLNDWIYNPILPCQVFLSFCWETEIYRKDIHLILIDPRESSSWIFLSLSLTCYGRNFVMTSNERFVKERKKGRLPDRVIVIINIFLLLLLAVHGTQQVLANGKREMLRLNARARWTVYYKLTWIIIITR